ncbi:MAG: nucleotide pyrophosphohydrolase [Limisphaerales bacterium]
MKSYESIVSQIRAFRDARDWMQFHNPKNLAISISLEANELLEHFQWKSMEESEAYAKKAPEELGQEMADVAIYLFELADNIGVDLFAAIEAKLQHNDAKYPASKVRGSSKKYTEYSANQKPE